MVDLLMDSRRAIRPLPARTALRPNWVLGFPADDIGSADDWRKPLKFRSPAQALVSARSFP
jgi:hypothetical protein